MGLNDAYLPTNSFVSFDVLNDMSRSTGKTDLITLGPRMSITESDAEREERVIWSTGLLSSSFEYSAWSRLRFS